MATTTYKHDRFRKEGAEQIARAVETFWRRKGRAVKAWAEPLTDMEAFGRLCGETKFRVYDADDTLYVVRSTLVNGMPAAHG